jgi:ribosomal protein S18 acetylase RimI-like enzyme
MPGMPPLSFRLVTVAEASAVVALWREAEAEPTHTDDEASVRRLIERDPAALIVAVDAAHTAHTAQAAPGVTADGRLVGSVIAGWDGWRGSIYRLAVVPSHRRRGLGGQLVRLAEERLAEAGAMRCQAIVVESDPQAVAFWQTSGWERQSERLRFVRG